MKGKILTMIVNNFTEINKTNNHLSPQISEDKKHQDIGMYIIYVFYLLNNNSRYNRIKGRMNFLSTWTQKLRWKTKEDYNPENYIHTHRNN